MGIIKRAAILATCMALAGGMFFAVVTARRLRQPVAAAAVAEHTTQPEPDPIQQFRTEREQLRAMQKSQLNEMIHSTETDAETRRMAQRRLLTLMEAEEREAMLEGLLSARGFEDALVTVSENAINVVVRREVLNQRETAIILEMVMRETGISGGNVKIMPIK